MSGTAAERLKTLVTDYYHGLLTFDSYREQRGKLFDALQLEARRPPAQPAAAPTPAAAPEESDETQTNVALRPPPELVAAVVAAPAPAPRPQPQARPFPRNLVFAGGGVAVAAAALIAFVVFRPGPEDVPAVPSETNTAPAAALPPGAALLEQFAQRNVWTPDAISNLEVTWESALTDEQRRAARESPSYSRFAETLRNRLRGEEALSVGQVSAELTSLVSLAKRLEMPFAASLELPKPGDAPVAPAPQVVQPPAVAADLPAPDSGAVVASPPPSTADTRSTPPAPAETSPPAAPTQPPVVAPGRQPAAVPAPVVAASPEQAAPSAGAAQAAGDAASACSASMLETRRLPSCRDPLRGAQEGPALMILPPGKFVMGGDGANEGPQHEVNIPAPIAMSIYEVSAADFNLYCTSAGVACPDNPWPAGDFPAVLVSFADATAYAAWLSAETGQRYRLPSEAEWEYAARAGTTTPYPFGDAVTPSAARSSVNGAVDSPLANSDRSVNRNQFRLFHMIGNVREWVADEWHADHAGAPTDGSAREGAATAPHVVRGGAYTDAARQLRSAARSSLPPDTRDRSTGLRVVRELGD